VLYLLVLNNFLLVVAPSVLRYRSASAMSESVVEDGIRRSL
jgi:hypothetical protein